MSGQSPPHRSGSKTTRPGVLLAATRLPNGSSLLLQSSIIFASLFVLASCPQLAAGAQPQAHNNQQQANVDRQSQGAAVSQDDEYLIGVGIADITGPSADINLVSFFRQLAESAAELFASGPPSRPSRSSSSSLSPSASPSPALKQSPAARPQRSNARSTGGIAPPLRSPSSPSLISVLNERAGPSLRSALARSLAELLDQLRGGWPGVSSQLAAPSSGRLKRAPGHLFKLTDRVTKANKKQATVSLDDRPLVNVQYPSWRDLSNVKLQIKMGYAKPNQDAGGIHLRQFSRALVVEDRTGNRAMYINLDNGMISQLLRTRVLHRLRGEFGEQLYNESNVMLSATHTHSCPGGFFQYMLYNIPSAGFISQTLEALVEGVVRSVGRAHESLQPGRVYLAKGELLDASVNRSPTSYANNPPEERARYAHDTDKTMWLLRFDDRQGRPLAALNWFAVHGTSMNNTNHLISSDNKGYAALLLERDFNPPGTLPGKGKFVAMFAQANEGDVSPNTRGPRCIDTGLPCDSATSTCGSPPRNEKCIASGPGRDMFESTQMIAYKQYFQARQLFLDTKAQLQVRGPVRFVHEHIDMTKQQVPVYDSLVGLHKRAAATSAQQRQQQQQLQLLQPARLRRHQELAGPAPAPVAPNATLKTCSAALGYSFAAGTTDGPGAFDFQQGDTASTRYWNMVRDFLRRPSEEQIQCHHPKPILLSTGEMDFPYMWHPKVVPTQILMIGQVAIVGLPGEFTTMAGRRVRQAVKEVLEANQARVQALDFTSYEELQLSDEELDDQDEGLQRFAGRHLAAKTTASDADLTGDEARTRSLRLKARQQRHSAGQQQSQQQRAQLEVILSGLSNIYTSYVTTIEEYEVQRYEGASTLYGPHTLQAYINQFRRLASLLVPGRGGGNAPLDDTLQPPDLTKSLFTLKAGVLYDGAPHGKNFGDALSQPDAARVYRCREQVSVSFVAGNPRNDLRQESSFLFVDKFDEATRAWTPVATDASWETKFIWERTNTLFGESKATIEWNIPEQCQTGVYRIRHVGAHKTLLQTVSQYAGKSVPFRVSAAAALEPVGAETGSQIDAKLEAQLHLAEQVEALQSGVEASEQMAAQAASQFKSDEGRAVPTSAKSDRQLGSLISAPFKYLSSMIRWKW